MHSDFVYIFVYRSTDSGRIRQNNSTQVHGQRLDPQEQLHQVYIAQEEGNAFYSGGNRSIN